MKSKLMYSEVSKTEYENEKIEGSTRKANSAQ